MGTESAWENLVNGIFSVSRWFDNVGHDLEAEDNAKREGYNNEENKNDKVKTDPESTARAANGVNGANVEISNNKDGSTNVKFNINAKVQNSVGASKDEIEKWSSIIKIHIETTYFTYDEESDTYYSAEVKFDLQSKVDPDKDYYFDFVSELKIGERRISGEGYTSEIGNTKSNRMQIVAPGYASDPRSIASLKTIGRTGAHEVGHTFGLRHQNDRLNNIRIDAYNLMYQGGSQGSELILQQFKYSMRNAALHQMARGY